MLYALRMAAADPNPEPAPISDEERARFDALLEEALENLPPRLRGLLEEVPLVVDDRPEPALVAELYDDSARERGETLAEFARTLCGLHTGVPLTERSVEQSAVLPTGIRVFREGVVEVAGGWAPAEDETEEDVEEAIYEEITITILHEIGHHFGLDEADLEELGYD